jgi:predicted solute-binding protein
MTYSNLSKIRPKLRTSGNITGNFGKSKVKAGSTLNEIGMTNKENIKCATQDEYLNRLYYAFDNTDDDKLKNFIYTEIRKIHVQRGTW